MQSQRMNPPLSSRTISKPHFSLVSRYLRSFNVPSTYPGDKSDLFQVGVLGILRALSTFNEERSSFSTWAWFWIRSAIRDEVSKHRHQVFNEDQGDIGMDRAVLLKQLHDLIENDKDKEVYVMYLCGMTTTDIGKIWGVSRQCVHQRLNRLKSNIKEKTNSKLQGWDL